MRRGFTLPKASYVKQVSSKAAWWERGSKLTLPPPKGPHVGRGNWEAWVADPTVPLPACVWSWTSSNLSVLNPLTHKMQRRCVPLRSMILQAFLPALSGAWRAWELHIWPSLLAKIELFPYPTRSLIDTVSGAADEMIGVPAQIHIVVWEKL